MRQVQLAAVVSALPARSTARTRNVCFPACSPVNVTGEEHGFQFF